MIGSHFKLVSSETVDVTPQLAADFHNMEASPTERDPKTKRKDYLRDSILGGRAIAFVWTKAKVLDTGRIVRVNGNHSSTVLTELNGQFPEGLKAHIDTYEVANNAELGLLFRQIDSRMSARSVDDIAGAYHGLQPDLANVPKLAARRAIEGYVWYAKNKVGSDVPSGDDRFDLFSASRLHPFIQMTGRILSVKTPEFSTPVVGAMYGTFDREPAKSEEFYSAVAKGGGGNAEDHPATVLDMWLVESREQKENKPTEKEIYYACAYAWNAFRKDKTIDRIPKYNKKKGAPELE